MPGVEGEMPLWFLDDETTSRDWLEWYVNPPGNGAETVHNTVSRLVHVKKPCYMTALLGTSRRDKDARW